MSKKTVPFVDGCLVKLADSLDLYSVKSTLDDGGVELVRAERAGPSKVVSATLLRSGFARGMAVYDVPRSRVRRSLGEGEVVATRVLAGREQVLVELLESGQRSWFPFETLRHVWDTRSKFCHQQREPRDAERFRLRTLAYALTQWQANTGALARLDIDPLPHQIRLVHDILASGTLNWLIADDVGLGKTIEVGMLLTALTAGRGHERFLVVVPAGLTRQWKDELTGRFGLEGFRIYGDDFRIDEAREWALYPRAIASLDRLKTGDHLAKIRDSGFWDLIVFDEGHRLTRVETGRGYRSSERFKLAAELRRHTDSLMLLTATPHQGKPDMFEALLELLRPEWKSLIQELGDNPEVIRDVIYRNRKSQVTDIDGEFIFRGQRTHALDIPSSETERKLDAELRKYLTQAYAVAETLGGRGRAIGFVLTTYRKLSASSPAALRDALMRRLARILNFAAAAGVEVRFDDDGRPVVVDGEAQSEQDDRFEGEAAERFAGVGESAAPFFDEEITVLSDVVECAKAAVLSDTKRSYLLNRFIPEILTNDERLLIFTEFKGTLNDLSVAISERHGPSSLVQIHGSMSLEQRLEAVQEFTEGTARFLISTEAGGEGINLHVRCHTVLNYDLPWNPMRLVQRVGRVYRYGQTKTVEVYNMCATSTLDSNVVQTIYQRIDQVVQDLCGLGADYAPGMRSEIFGDIVALADLETIIEQARTRPMERTTEEIDKALRSARDAKQLQDKMLVSARSFSASEFQAELRLGKDHVLSFVSGMLATLGGTISLHRKDGTVMEAVLSDALKKELKMPGEKLRYSVERERAKGGVQLTDFESAIVQRLLGVARRPDFGGQNAAIGGLPGRALAVGRCRWQNEQGRTQYQELVLSLMTEDGSFERNPAFLADWLRSPALHADVDSTVEERTRIVEATDEELDDVLGERCNDHLHPQQRSLLALALCASLRSRGGT